MFLSVKENLQYFKEKLNNNQDVATRTLSLNGKDVGIIFIKSMMDKEVFVPGIMAPLMDFDVETGVTLDILEREILKAFELERIYKDEDVLAKLLEYHAVLFLDGEKEAISLDLEKAPIRMPSEPPTSAVILGPREGFTEDLKTNIGLIRKRLRTDKLKMHSLEVGRYTKSKVCIFSIDGVADEKLIERVIKKMENINIDGVVDSHYLLSFLQEGQSLLFKQVGTAEKPDIVVAKMLEGRIAVAVDGSPVFLTLPFVVIEDLQSSNDYYTNPIYVSFIRVIRAFGILCACVVPGVFLSFKLYHYKALPLKYLITVSNSTQGLPFTPFVEMIFILILFQILYEVSLRLPRYLGLATSIVGALILGDTGVKAGLISPPAVIIIAMSIISLYTVPEQAPQLTIIRAVLMLLGGTVGLLGVVAGMIYFINRMNALDLFGVPYLAPYSPRVKHDLQDGIMKSSLVTMKERPKSIPNKN